jgi:hypothetical protein
MFGARMEQGQLDSFASVGPLLLDGASAGARRP